MVRLVSEPSEQDHRWWQEPLAELVSGRRVITVGGPAAYWTPHVAAIRDAGATDVLVYGTEGVGVGPQPAAQVVTVDRLAAPLMDAIRQAKAMSAHPPPEVLAALADFDRDRHAVVFGSFLHEAPQLDGRDLVAYRRPEWVHLEDKTLVDDLLDRAGVTHLQSAVVPVEAASRRWRDFDGGSGAVIAGDSREGFHGGASLTRWVVDDATVDAALEDLVTKCDLVRIMPFVDGTPCSIHGVVFEHDVAALRPVEMVTLRRGHELVYTGCATFWDPAPSVREAMRDAARRLGGVLRTEVSFRGGFTLDGVVADGCFWPTELNPRFGAGLATITRGLGDIPLPLVLDLIVSGRLSLSAAELEAKVVPVADARRSGSTMVTPSEPIESFEARPLSFDGMRWAWSGEDDAADGTVVSGGTIARLMFDPERTPKGDSVGDRAVAFHEFCDGELGTAFGSMTAAPNVR
jgi:hypothetical protein